MAKLFGSLESLYQYCNENNENEVKFEEPTNYNFEYLLNNLIIDHETKFAENAYIKTSSDIIYRHLISRNPASITNIEININNKLILDYVKQLNIREGYHNHAAFLTYYSFDLLIYYECEILLISKFSNLYRYYNDSMFYNETKNTMYMLHGKTTALKLKANALSLIKKISGSNFNPSNSTRKTREQSIKFTDEVI